MTARITIYLAKKLLKVDKEYNTVHSFYTMNNGVIIGQDYDFSQLSEDLQRAVDIRIAGEDAINAGHGIAVLWEDDPYWTFFEHKEKEMKEYLELLEEVEQAEKEYWESIPNCKCAIKFISDKEE